MTPTETPEPARLLVAAEREVVGRRARDVVARTLGAALVADALAVLALLMPWAGAATAPITGLQVSFTFTGVVLVGIVLRQVVLRAAAAAPDASSYPMVFLVAALSTIAAVAVWVQQPRVAQTLAAGEVSRLPPLAFAVAFLAGGGFACLAAARVRRVIDDVDLLEGIYVRDPELLRERFAGAVEDALRHPRNSWTTAAPGVAGLLLAAAGLLAPWQEQVASLLAGDAPAYAMRADELSQTLALRWTVAVALAGTLAVVTAERLRRLRSVALIASGTAILVLAGRSAPAADAPGVWLTSAGAIFALLAGLVELSRRTRTRHRRVRAVVAAGAVVAMAAGVAVLANAAVFDPVARPTASTYPGRPLAIADAGTPHRSTVAVSASGQVWTLRTDEQGVLLGVLTDGRFTATTHIRTPGSDHLDLLAVTDGQAVLLGDDRYRASSARAGDVTYVSLVSIHARTAAVGAVARTSTPDVSRTVLRAEPDYVAHGSPATAADVHAGLIRTAFLDAHPVADGSMVVSLLDVGGHYPPRNYLVPAADVTGRPTWPLTRALPADPATTWNVNEQAFGPGGVRLQLGTSLGNLAWLLTTARTRAVVIGGVSDRRCRPSRDPLSSYVDPAKASPFAAIDGRGDLWVANPAGAGARLAVRTPDGVLRTVRVPSGRPVAALDAAPDGSLLITRLPDPTDSSATFTTTRLVHAERLAEHARALPSRAPDCISENRLRATLTGGGSQTVTGGEVAGLPTKGSTTQAVVTRADGTVVWARPAQGAHHRATDLIRSSPGHRPGRLVRAYGTVDRLLADGRGGAWWLLESDDPNTTARRYSVWHVDARGHAGRMAGPLPVSNESAAYRAAVDAAAVDSADGSLLWRLRSRSRAWLRTALSGRTTNLGYVGDEPVVAGGTGFATGTQGGVLLRDLVPRRVLVGAQASTTRLSLFAAAAARAPLALVDPQVRGVAVTRRGHVVLCDGSGIARVDGDHLVMLGQPDERLLILPGSMTVIGDHAYFVGSDRLVHRVRVS